MAKDMSQEEAFKIIQMAERARQGRLRAKLNIESKNMNWMYRTKEPGAAAIELATVCIQKVLNIILLYMLFNLPMSLACVIFHDERFE